MNRTNANSPNGDQADGAMHRTTTENVFDQAAATWDDTPRRVTLATAIGAAILREVQPSPDMHVLDYGCGTGLLGLSLRPHVRSVTGADSSSGMLETLARKIREMQLDGMHLLHLDLQRDPLPNRRFHMIVTAMTMHHIRDVDSVLAAFCRLLWPKGVLCVADLDSEPGIFHFGSVGETVHHHGFDRHDLKRRMAQYGFGQLRDLTAHTIQKQVGSGEIADFPVFLAIGQRTE